MTIKELYDISATNYKVKVSSFDSGKTYFKGWLSDIPISFCNFIIKRIWFNDNDEINVVLEVEGVYK